ncbi:MAG: pyridoxamine 5'-phosphate oxidase family protein [Chloroflexi bacterium]|nr:pyridoxamine 5'-phosphate oxidase family protein [Chloroflexota bacterium]
MSILEVTTGLLDALRGEMTPKFLATRSAAGVPNVVPCVSIMPAGDQPDTVIFGNFLLRKSIRNLKEDARVGILVITPELRGWILTGDFVEFQRTGPYVDRQMSSSLLRYNAYTGIRDAGIMRVRSVVTSFEISKMQVAKDYALARAAALVGAGRSEKCTVMPLAVQREFEKMAAVKVLAWIGENGYPQVVPALSLQPAGVETLVCHADARLPQPPPGVQVATNILTFEAISYQAKGKWAKRGNTGTIQVQEVYAGGPPLPGGRVA